jgi:hypothetical protein
VLQVVPQTDEERLEMYRRNCTFDELAKMHIAMEKLLPQSAGVYEDVEMVKKCGVRQCQFSCGDFRCSAEADYKIVFEEERGNKPENSVDTCLEHIYAMLSDAVEQKLVKISLRKVRKADL